MTTSLTMLRIGAIAALASLLTASAARAAHYDWSWSGGSPAWSAHSDTAGAFQSIQASYDSTLNELAWSVTFSNQLTQGFSLVVSDGAYPTSSSKGLAILYFDARSLAAPKLTAYAYNADAFPTSYMDGDITYVGVQAPDRIKATLDPSWIKSVKAQDTATTRTLSFLIDVGPINSHAPLYGPFGVNAPWLGAAFGDTLGFLMRTDTNLGAAYDANGYLTQWSWGNEGWFAGAGLTTQRADPVVAPLPTGAGLAAAGLCGLAFVRRRRA